ncbi:MAG: hypothetical protein JWN62_4494 [Acidimicrobiales bacterium]|nr:hypothetical protein [Acidimicrobiales bacterium]
MSIAADGRRRGIARVGCSGWHYRDWRGLVYPEALRPAEWFGYYTLLFDTVELNNTFYRLPTPAAADGWAEQAPDGFVYALKLGQFGSHRKKLIDAVTWLPNHLDRARRLGSTMGPTVVQLPPRWKRNTARLDEFLTVAPNDLRWVVEVRDPSWLHEDTYAILRRHGAALCVHDLIDGHPFEMTTGWTYVRFHGPDAVRNPYRGRYGPALLQPWADKLNAILDAGQDVYCYFNNDYDGAAVADAQWLRHAVDPSSRWG